MSTWPAQTLNAIASSDDLHIAPYRPDGTTLGTLTWIWSVVVDGALYVRAYNGTASRWHQAVLAQRAGVITAAGALHDVSFEPVGEDDAVQDAVDGAYRTKYAGSAYLGAMVGSRARAATVLVVLRSDG